jgi:hypothetical protein
MQHDLNFMFKDGVHDSEETVETLYHAENRDMETVEGRADVA